MGEQADTGILASVKVVDLSAITAGARSTQLLADFGADVIKVESPTRPDPFRHWKAVTGSVGTGDLASPPFRVANRNKRAVAVDLKTDTGVEIFRRLIEWGDIVVENFRRGVMDRLGLSFETLQKWNPRIVLLSISSQGADGPEADYVSFGGTLEALSGLMSVTGYDPSTPTWSTNKINYPDQLVSAMAPGLAAWAIMQARLTGRGHWVDLAQRETVSALLGDLIAHDAETGTPSRPSANRGPAGDSLCCACAGEDQWVAVTIPDDETWIAACRVVGAPAPSGRPSADEMESAISTWSATRDKDEAMHTLQSAHVPAAAVLASWEVTHDVAGLGESLLVDVPRVDGTGELQMRWPFELVGEGNPAIGLRAPHLGEHTVNVLTDLGYSSGEIANFLSRQVVSQWSDRLAADSDATSESVLNPRIDDSTIPRIEAQ